MPIYEELFYLGTGRYVDFMRSNLRRNLITQTNRLIYAEISAQTQEIIAGNDELAREFGKGFDATNRTLEWGFTNIADRLSEISSTIEDLRADFNYNIGLVIEQMQIQNKLITEVIEKLDAIHKILESPLLTQAREFYRIGTERLQRGLLDKALEAFLKAEEKNDADFFTEFQLGKLYLYGIDEDDNVIDLKQAQKHLRLAIRYGKGELRVIPDFNRWVGEACFHAAIAYYVSVNEPEIKENPVEIKMSIEEARDLVRESCEIYPQISEAYYHYAKFSALLGDAENTVSNLEKAILMDRRYCIKAEIDKDFDAVRPKVIELYEKLRKDSEIKARELLNQAKGYLSKVHIYSEEGKQVREEAEKLIHDAEILIEKNTYFSYLDAIPYLKKAIEISSCYYDRGIWANCVFYKILEGPFLPITFSPDGKFLVGGSYDSRNSITIWDANDGRLIRRLEKASTPNFLPLAISPDGKLLAGYNYAFPGNAIIQIRDANDGGLIRTLGESRRVDSIAFSPDGKFLACGSYGESSKNLIQVWEANDGKLIRALEGEKSLHAFLLALSNDGKFLATAGFNDDLIQIWSVNDGKLIRTISDEGSSVLSMALSPDGKFLACASEGYRCKIIKIWYVNDGSLIKTLEEDWIGGRICPMAFSHDGKFLVSGEVPSIKATSAYSSKIKIWKRDY